jgi:hypothetical protein
MRNALISTQLLCTFLLSTLLFFPFNTYAASLETSTDALFLLKNKGLSSLRLAAPITDDHHVIRIGIFYTEDLLEALTKEQLNEYLNIQINAANVVMENSGLAIRREVGYVGLYPIKNSSVDIQGFLRTIYDNDAKAVHDIANDFGLDYLTILRPHNSNSYCGWAYYTDPYAVMELGGNCTSDTLGAHEWGHNDGADHDIANSSDTPKRDYGRGYNCGGEGTIMSTSNNWFNRHSFYSSPSKSVDNDTCGDEEKANVTRMLKELSTEPNQLGNIRETPQRIARVRFSAMVPILTVEGEQTEIELMLVDNNDNVITLDRDASVELFSQSDSAFGEIDYQELGQRITFLAGESSKKAMVSILKDNLAESTESFLLGLRYGDIIEPETTNLLVNIAENEGSKMTYSLSAEELNLRAGEEVSVMISREGDFLGAEDLFIDTTLTDLTIEQVILTFEQAQSSQIMTFIAHFPLTTQTGNVAITSMITGDTVASITISIVPTPAVIPTKKSSGGSMPLISLAGLVLLIIRRFKSSVV